MNQDALRLVNEINQLADDFKATLIDARAFGTGAVAMSIRLSDDEHSTAISIALAPEFLAPPITYPETPFSEHMESYDHEKLAMAMLFNAAYGGPTPDEVTRSRLEYRERAERVMRELRHRFMDSKAAMQAARYLVGATERERELLLSFAGSPYQTLPTGELIQPSARNAMT